MKRAVITGPTGAIGIALIRKLIEENTEILVITRKESLRNNNIPVHPLITRIYCPLDGFGKLENTTGKKYDVFYHLAWMGAVGQGRHDMYMQNENVKYALDAVGAAKRFGCRLFIGAGSQAEYGKYEGTLKPDTPVFPTMGYGFAKLCAGQMTREYAHQLGLKHIWVRILSVYGPNDGLQSMVMSTICKLKAGETPQYTRAEQQWDYLYNGDAALALYLLGKNGQDGKVYVLGSGCVRQLSDYIMQIRDIVAPGTQIRLGDLPYNKDQTMYLCADLTEITNDVGFVPQISFEEGIRRTEKWLMECADVKIGSDREK